MADPTIILRANLDGGYSVVVQPPAEGGNLNRDFPTYPEARGYARGLRLFKGLPLRDHAESEVVR